MLAWLLGHLYASRCTTIVPYVCDLFTFERLILLQLALQELGGGAHLTEVSATESRLPDQHAQITVQARAEKWAVKPAEGDFWLASGRAWDSRSWAEGHFNVQFPGLGKLKRANLVTTITLVSTLPHHKAGSFLPRQFTWRPAGETPHFWHLTIRNTSLQWTLICPLHHGNHSAHTNVQLFRCFSTVQLTVQCRRDS